MFIMLLVRFVNIYKDPAFSIFIEFFTSFKLLIKFLKFYKKQVKPWNYFLLRVIIF